MKTSWIDITGKQFGSWKVLKYLNHGLWLCLCARCGKKRKIISQSLRRGRSTRCGECWAADRQTHGHSSNGRPSPTYTSWAAMWQRCTRKPTAVDYGKYTGRGIKICERWKKFLCFLEDMGERPAGTQLDRKNSNGNYEPDNCKWSTLTQQANNKSNNRHVIFQGQKMTRAEASREIGIPYFKLLQATRAAKVPENIVPFLILKRSSAARNGLTVLFGEQGGLFGLSQVSTK